MSAARHAALSKLVTAIIDPNIEALVISRKDH